MANFQQHYGAYGAMNQQHLNQGWDLHKGQTGQQCIIDKPGHMKASHRQRMRLNIVTIFVSLFLPWTLYTVLFAAVSFRLHYKMSEVCWLLVGMCGLLVVFIGAKAVQNVMMSLGFGNQLVGNHGGLMMEQYVQPGKPAWLLFLFLTSLIAVVAGPVMGINNFTENMEPYYSLQNLNDYSDVDPTRMRGQQMMDAGRVQFLPGATLDLSKAYAFQNVDTYCVAPISVTNPALGGPTPLASYDFWAVGINCCGGNSSKTVNFKCGAYNSATAHEGLRLMADEPRAFLRLAVQQAESAHMVTASHPLFFYWTENSIEEMHGYMEKAYRTFAIGMIGFFAIQMGFVYILFSLLGKMGYSNL